MKKEILFKARSLNSKDWHTGLLCHINDGWFVSNKLGVATAFTVDPTTISQFTGLIDSKGNKVFEGDIVKIDFDIGQEKSWTAKYVCTWNGTNYEYEFQRKGETLSVACCYPSEITVIGNVYDNPNLI